MGLRRQMGTTRTIFGKGEKRAEMQYNYSTELSDESSPEGHGMVCVACACFVYLPEAEGESHNPRPPDACSPKAMHPVPSPLRVRVRGKQAGVPGSEARKRSLGEGNRVEIRKAARATTQQ